MKLSRRVHKSLTVCVPEIRCTAQQLQQFLPGQPAGVDGRGVIVGVVDYGFDFVHPAFRNADGTTRLLSLWDQKATGSEPPAGYSYGRELTAADINIAFGQQDPYSAVRYWPDPGSHGTHVSSIAAGSGGNGAAP